jgi:hypothetical protein
MVRRDIIDVVAGRWTSPLPSSVLPVSRRTLEGFRPSMVSLSDDVATIVQRPTLSSFALLQSRHSLRPGRGYRPPLVRFARALRPPRHRCRLIGPDSRKSTPPSTSSPASTPARALPPLLRARGSLPGHRVPTSWFRTTSPVFAAVESQACCILLPIVGFIAFHAHFSAPSRCHSPFEEDLSRAAVPCRHGRYLRDVPSQPLAPLAIGVLQLRPFLTPSAASVTFKVLLRAGVLYLRAPYSGVGGLSFPGFRSPPRSFDLSAAVKLRFRRCTPRSAGSRIQIWGPPWAPICWVRSVPIRRGRIAAAAPCSFSRSLGRVGVGYCCSIPWRTRRRGSLCRLRSPVRVARARVCSERKLCCILSSHSDSRPFDPSPRCGCPRAD